MKLKLALLALVAAAGLLASLAIASPPGKGKKTTTTSTTAATTTTTSSKKVLVCHKVAKGKYVLLSVSKKSAPARLKKTKDVLAVNGTCPGPIQSHTGTTTTPTTTTTP